MIKRWIIDFKLFHNHRNFNRLLFSRQFHFLTDVEREKWDKEEEEEGKLSMIESSAHCMAWLWEMQ